MTKFVTFLFLLFFSINVFPQNSSELAMVNPLELIRNAKPLIYYGVDFSCVRITDGEKVSKNQIYHTVYPPAWITYIEKEMPPVGYVQRSLRIKNFYYKQDEIYSVSISVFPNFITGVNYSFPIDTIKNAIKKYNLSQKSGTGLVLIPENFNKPQEKAFTWVVLFDIQTREVLYANRFPGNCGHMGYTAHWSSGVIDGFKRFVHDAFKMNR